MILLRAILILLFSYFELYILLRDILILYIIHNYYTMHIILILI